MNVVSLRMAKPSIWTSIRARHCCTCCAVNSSLTLRNSGAGLSQCGACTVLVDNDAGLLVHNAGSPLCRTARS